MVKSKINPILTLDYMVHEPENKYFDRKSAKIKPSDLAPLISAFANAEGGTIVIGINDKTLEIEGVSAAGEDRLNDFINAAKDYCKPMPKNEYEYLNVVNAEGLPDKLLLIHIFPSQEQIVQTRKDETWLRIGDRTKEIKGNDLRIIYRLWAQLDDLEREILIYMGSRKEVSWMVDSLLPGWSKQHHALIVK